MQLILASGSPRRKELLGLFHIPFTIRVADIDEAMDSSKPPQEEVARVSRLKALAVPRDAEDVIIVGPGETLSTTMIDPFAAYEEAMAPANRLGDILQWVQLIPIFFAMKRWLFALEAATNPT